MEQTKKHTSRVVVVFGGTGAIGSAVCTRLVDQGVTVVSAARSADVASASAERLYHTPLDATDFDSVADAIQNIQSEHGQITGLVNAVGSMLLKPAHLTTRVEWEEALRTNLTSAFSVVRSGVKAMRSAGGSIVLISSAAASAGLRNHEAIAAAKAGVEGLTRSAAATYARSEIRVNCVAPGMVETPLSRPLLASEKARTSSESLHPLGRIGRPAEIASAVCWLLHPDQSWVTGHVLAVDGGLATVRGR